MEPTEEEIDAMAEEFRDVCRKTPSNAMDTLARHVQTNFTRNVPVTDDEIEALETELREICWKEPVNGLNAIARHVLSRPTPPGTIRLGTGLTAEQLRWDAETKHQEANNYERAAEVLEENVGWDDTTAGQDAWHEICSYLRQMAAALRAAAEPPVDPRIAVVQAELRRFVVGLPVDAAPAILAALDKVGGDRG